MALAKSKEPDHHQISYALQGTVLADWAPYGSTRNFPSRMIGPSSTQMLNFRPTTSMLSLIHIFNLHRVDFLNQRRRKCILHPK